VRDATVTKMLAAFFLDVSRSRAWGGVLGGLIPAVEPRLKIAVLHVAGLEMEQPLAEADPLNFVGHITIPALMVNGRMDPYFNVETSQRPMFELFDTPAEHKRHVHLRGWALRPARPAGEGDTRLVRPLPRPCEGCAKDVGCGKAAVTVDAGEAAAMGR
jgi:hypothetical protein